MSSFSSLGIGVSALSTAQRAVEVAAHNIANANTTGYTRQRLDIGTAMPTPGTLGLRGDGQRGMGVTVIGVERLRDRLSDAAWRSQASASASATARSQVLDRVQEVVGSYGNGMPQALSTFYASWDTLSLTPADPSARQGVLTAGKGLADGLNSAGDGLDAVAKEAGQRLLDARSELNGLLEHVSTLNLSIQDAQIDLAAPNDLMDERDTALDRIAQLTGATVERRDDGMVTVKVGDTALVDGGTWTPLQAEVADDGSPTVDPLDGLGGTMGGLVKTLTADVPSFRQGLADLRDALLTAVNGVHGASSSPSGPAGDFFAVDADGRLGLAPDLTEQTLGSGRSSSASDGDGALAMSALRTTPALGGATLTEAFRSFGTTLGQTTADATRAASTASSALDGASMTRASLNGVNVDEEMVDLVKFQHSYSAASRVITVIDEMLDKIINQMGR